MGQRLATHLGRFGAPIAALLTASAAARPSKPGFVETAA